MLRISRLAMAPPPSNTSSANVPKAEQRSSSPGIPCPCLFVPHELATTGVEHIVEDFAARRVRKCELDGIELSVGMDYLFANFLHPNGNRRSDQYGDGTLAELMTFLREVISTARVELGPDRLIGV